MRRPAGGLTSTLTTKFSRFSATRSPGAASTRSRDRKSTRLNSSHVRISYAVFCLKKKKQQYFFDMLWRKAIAAKQIIKEIEHGLKREFMESIQDPYEVQAVLNNSLNSVTEEILLTLTTKTTTLDNKRLYRYEQEYLIPLLRHAVARGVKFIFLCDGSPHELHSFPTRRSSD